MSIIDELPALPSGQNSIITIGVFDGVHLGHQYLLNRLVKAAARNNINSGVVTFKNHPAEITNAEFKPNFLCSLEDRLTRLRNTGVDFVAPITFDKEIANLDASEFLSIMTRQLKMSGLVVGPDFCMGKDRSADVKRLGELSKIIKFNLETIGDQSHEGLSFRSTTIRNLLLEGSVSQVPDLLGKYFSLTGKIIKGMKRGRTLEVPTANVSFNEDLAMPGNGIYATWARVGNKKFMAATSIGTNPTFGGNSLTVEAHLLDFNSSIYGSTITLEFVDKLRPQIAFDSEIRLKAQMKKDILLTREKLSSQIAPVGEDHDETRT